MNRHLCLLACALSAQILVHGQSFVTINVPFDPSLTVLRTTNQIEVSWRGEGVLERGASPEGAWTPIATNSSSWLTPAEQGQEFFRVRNPRPQSVQLFVPSAATNAETPLPLLILLHGFSATGSGEENYMKFQPQAEAKGFFYCHPDGVVGDTNGNLGWVVRLDDEYWFEETRHVDHAAILRSLIKEIIRTQPVDPQRVWVMGHSIGGEMAYRMAHDTSGLVSAVVSFVGPETSLAIPPSRLVNVLHIHCTDDDVIFYDGSTTLPGGTPIPYPGVFTLIDGWATYNGATGLETDTQPTMHLIVDFVLDTIVSRYTNAPAGGAVELWSIQGGSHGPPLAPTFAPAVADWLLSHPSPAQ